MCVTQLGPSMQCEFILKLEIHAKKLSTTLVQNIKLNVKLYTASTSRDRKLSDSLRPLKNESQNMVSITRTVAVIINKVVMLLGEIYCNFTLFKSYFSLPRSFTRMFTSQFVSRMGSSWRKWTQVSTLSCFYSVVMIYEMKME
ncbi:Hypothetical_protein [Hexamita inflata]|uniref:Hypothetical_protein n=1 Tax=Hexamita inflata TaxID=28002 RepID=A0AA86Q852_9EUKA|nr:Hypothetical protein HINF_LOCUS35454 [Hexamita inflata]